MQNFNVSGGCEGYSATQVQAEKLAYKVFKVMYITCYCAYRVIFTALFEVIEMANVSFRTDDETKAQAAELFRDLGLDMSTAINMFLRQSIVSNGIPFTPRRESPTNALSRAEVESRSGASFRNVAELMEDLNEAD